MPSVPSNAVFRALADPTRRQILSMLRDGPRTSGDIASRFESSWPTISRHLAILHDGSLVVARRRGQEIHYELNTSVFQDLACRNPIHTAGLHNDRFDSALNQPRSHLI